MEFDPNKNLPKDKRDAAIKWATGSADSSGTYDNVDPSKIGGVPSVDMEVKLVADSLVREAERLLTGGQDTKKYHDTEGFTDAFEELGEHELRDGQFLLHSSGVNVDPVTGDTELHWEDQNPVPVQDPGVPPSGDNPSLN